VGWVALVAATTGAEEASVVGAWVMAAWAVAQAALVVGQPLEGMVMSLQVEVPPCWEEGW
jgi:hypothetical protein